MRVAVTGPIVCLSLVLLAVAIAHGDDKEDERVEQLMELIHEGRRSPYGQLRRVVAGEQADWTTVERAVAAFEPMRRALAESKVDDIRDSADGYLDAVQEMRDALGRRDGARFRRAFTGLTESCGDCHFEGGIGGELEPEDDDEEDREALKDRNERAREAQKERAERMREAQKERADGD